MNKLRTSLDVRTNRYFDQHFNPDDPLPSLWTIATYYGRELTIAQVHAALNAYIYLTKLGIQPVFEELPRNLDLEYERAQIDELSAVHHRAAGHWTGFDYGTTAGIIAAEVGSSIWDVLMSTPAQLTMNRIMPSVFANLQQIFLVPEAERTLYQRTYLKTAQGLAMNYGPVTDNAVIGVLANTRLITSLLVGTAVVWGGTKAVKAGAKAIREQNVIHGYDVRRFLNRITRTEPFRTANEIVRDQLIKVRQWRRGIKRGEVSGLWKLSLGPGACEKCAAVALAGPTRERSDLAPIHPNCNCTTEPVLITTPGTLGAARRTDPADEFDKDVQKLLDNYHTNIVSYDRVANIGQLNMGIHRVRFKDGTSAIEKHMGPAGAGAYYNQRRLDGAENEALVSRLARYLGARVPTTVNLGGGTILMDEILGVDGWGIPRSARKGWYTTAGGKELGLLDWLIVMDDRNNGNYRINALNGQVYGIDHEYAQWLLSSGRIDSPFAEQWYNAQFHGADTPIPKAQLTSMYFTLEDDMASMGPLASAFRDAGRLPELANVMTRLSQLIMRLP